MLIICTYYYFDNDVISDGENLIIIHMYTSGSGYVEIQTQRVTQRTVAWSLEFDFEPLLYYVFINYCN